jgi:hypothetical protein
MPKADTTKAADFNHFVKWQSNKLDLEFSLVEQADQPLRDGFFALAVATYKALHGKRSTNSSLLSVPFQWLNLLHANSMAKVFQLLRPFVRMASLA